MPCDCAACRVKWPQPATGEDLRIYQHMADNYWSKKAMSDNQETLENAQRRADFWKAESLAWKTEALAAKKEIAAMENAIAESQTDFSLMTGERDHWREKQISEYARGYNKGYEDATGSIAAVIVQQ